MSEKRFMEINQRVTVDFDEESYYLDGEYWESWDNYGEEMANKINKLLATQDDQIIKQKLEIRELQGENELLKNIIVTQIETWLELPFIKKIYCDTLLRILDEEDSVDKAKKYIKDYFSDYNE